MLLRICWTFVVVAAIAGAVVAQQPAAMKARAPELKDVDQWINSDPLTFEKLRGKVVVVTFWTFG